MKFLFEVLKRILKVIALYLAFGFVIALIISFSGTAKNLLIFQTMGAMTVSDFMLLLAYMELLWLPLLVGMVLSPHNYLSFPFSSWLVPIIVVSFFVMMIHTAIKE